MRLYDLSWGPYPRRVTIYIREKGIQDIEIVPLWYGEQREPHMMRKSPLGYIPVLELDDGRCLTDSVAILEYLEEIHPSPNFIGRTPVERQRMRAYVNLCNEFFIRCLPYYANILPQFSRVLKQSPETAAFTKPFMERSLEGLEKLADEKGPFLMGASVSMADCALYPMVHHNAENYGDHFLTDQYPKLKRWAGMFAKRDSAACPLRDDGLREIEFKPEPGKRYWWQQNQTGGS